MNSQHLLNSQLRNQLLVAEYASHNTVDELSLGLCQLADHDVPSN